MQFILVVEPSAVTGSPVSSPSDTTLCAHPKDFKPCFAGEVDADLWDTMGCYTMWHQGSWDDDRVVLIRISQPLVQPDSCYKKGF